MPQVAVVWRLATVRQLIDETPRARTLVLDVPDWPGHIAGQHVDVRLTADNGCQTERSFSIASAPERAPVALTVERIDGGEVSPYRDELAELTGDGLVAHFTFTREPPPDWRGFARRIDAEMLRTVGPTPHQWPHIDVCGPTAFVERSAELLVQLGHQPGAIRTERFGPSG
jgi:ferredoxin-NADP reductase